MDLDVSAPQHQPNSLTTNKHTQQIPGVSNMAIQRLNATQLNKAHLLNNNTTWPISPIYSSSSNNNNHLIFNGVGRMNCESPTVVRFLFIKIF